MALDAWPQQYPRGYELTVSLALLLAAYLAARALSYVFGRALARASTERLDDRLLGALKRPVTYSLFLLGAWGALNRLPVSAAALRYLNHFLFFAGLVLVTVAVLRAYGILLAWYAERPRPERDDRIAAEFGPLFAKAGKVVIVVFALASLLEHFGLEVRSLVVSLGVGSLAVGLAAQDTLSNMFAGFAIMADRTFRVGDRIQLACGDVGDVEYIGIRTTHIRTPDGPLLIVPNSLLVKERVVNQSRPTRHATARVDVSVAYGSDLDQVRQILLDAALGSKRVDEARPPAALVTGFGDHGIGWRLTFWVRDYLDAGPARSEVHEAVYRRFAEAGIDIPFPTRRILHEDASRPPVADAG